MGLVRPEDNVCNRMTWPAHSPSLMDLLSRVSQ